MCVWVRVELWVGLAVGLMADRVCLCACMFVCVCVRCGAVRGMWCVVHGVRCVTCDARCDVCGSVSFILCVTFAY